LRVTSPNIFTLGQASGIASPEITDQDLLIPGVLQPILTIPGATARLPILNTTEQQSSFIASSTAAQAASAAAATITLCTFGRGLWRMLLTAGFVASFVEASGGVDNCIQLVDPGQTNLIRLIKFFGATTPQFASIVFDILFLEGGWAVFLRFGATGVGQTIDMTAGIVASKLL